MAELSSRTALDAEVTRRAMRLSILEGSFALQYITVTTATLLVGLLLALGATTAQIGLVATFPLLSGLLQPLGAELVRRRGGWRKGICVTAVLIDDLLWLVTFGIIALWPGPQAVVGVIAVLAVQQVVTAFTALTWTSWISDLVPRPLRGRYFGRRNFICNGLGAITAVLAGLFIEHVGQNALWSFCAVIGVGMVFRLASAYMLWRQPEPFPARNLPGRFRDQLAAPLADRNFRSFVVFGMAWGFTVQMAAPFFAVYMIRDLALDFGLVALFGGLSIVANLFGQRFWGTLCDRYGNAQVMRLTALVIGVQPLWWLFTSASAAGLVLIAVLNITGGFAWGGFLLSSGNLMMGLAPETGKTSFFAMQAALSGLFSAFGPLVGGVLAGVLPAVPLSYVHPSGLLMLFFISFVLRMGALVLLHRVQEPVRKPQLHVIYLIRDAIRGLATTQGFTPWLHPFTVDLEEDDVDMNEILDDLTTRNP